MGSSETPSVPQGPIRSDSNSPNRSRAGSRRPSSSRPHASRLRFGRLHPAGELSAEACRRVLSSASSGRLDARIEHRDVHVSVPYVLHDDVIVLRADAGGIAPMAIDSRPVRFQVVVLDVDTGQRFQVTVAGIAERPRQEDLEGWLPPDAPHPFAPHADEQAEYVLLRPESVEGNAA